MRAFVTGAAGFIGSNLARRLCVEGHEVVAVDSLTDYYSKALKRANAVSVAAAGARFVEADLNTADLDELLDGSDVIFHLAGQPGVRTSWGPEFAGYVECNVAATQRLLEACRKKSDLRKLIFASSSSVYGDARNYPTAETDCPRPVSPYGVSKLAAELLCSLYALNFGIPTLSLRYFTVYGPGQRPDMAFTRFARAAIAREEIHVFGSGDQIRDFTYVDDVVEASILSAQADSIRPGAIFNVAGGSYSSVNSVLAVLEELVGTELSVVRQSRVPGDVMRTGGETAAIRSTLGWQPRVGLREGLKRQLDWIAGTANEFVG